MAIRVKFVPYGEHAKVKIVGDGQDMDVVSVTHGEDFRVKRVQEGEVFKVRLLPDKGESKQITKKPDRKKSDSKLNTLISYTYNGSVPDLSQVRVFRPITEKLWKNEK